MRSSHFLSSVILGIEETGKQTNIWGENAKVQWCRLNMIKIPSISCTLWVLIHTKIQKNEWKTVRGCMFWVPGGAASHREWHRGLVGYWSKILRLLQQPTTPSESISEPLRSSQQSHFCASAGFGPFDLLAGHWFLHTPVSIIPWKKDQKLSFFFIHNWLLDLAGACQKWYSLNLVLCARNAMFLQKGVFLIFAAFNFLSSGWFFSYFLGHI